MITFKQIEAFHCVVRLGGIVKASQRLNTTESTISKRLQELEAALGAEVFKREGRALILNSQGRQILPKCESLLDIRADIYRITKPNGGTRETLSIGLTELVAATHLEAMIDAFKENFPSLEISPTIGWNDILVQGLRDHTLDIIICPTAPVNPGEFNCTMLGANRSEWVCSPKLLPGGKIDDLSQLANMTLILQPVASTYQERILAYFQQHGLSPSRVLTAPSLAGLRDLATIGLGAAALPPAYCREQIAAGKLQIIDTPVELPALQYAAFCNRHVIDPTILKATAIVADIIGPAAFR